jgi:hypothetical protein
MPRFSPIKAAHRGRYELIAVDIETAIQAITNRPSVDDRSFRRHPATTNGEGREGSNDQGGAEHTATVSSAFDGFNPRNPSTGRSRGDSDGLHPLTRSVSAA